MTAPDPALAFIADQRARKWPDIHPEDLCHRCGRANIVWWTDSDDWNAATKYHPRGNLAILCPGCFVALWNDENGGGCHVTWRLVKEVHDGRH